MFTVSDLKQTKVYQEALEEGLEQGLEQGLERGLEQGLAHERSLIIRLLTRKFSVLSDDEATAIRALSFEQLERLGDALLDFKQVEDLETWLKANQ